MTMRKRATVAVSEDAPSPSPRPYSDAAFAVFCGLCATALYQWRFSSVGATLFTLLLCVLCAPGHFAARTYQQLMAWPDRFIEDFSAPPDWFVFGVTWPLRRLFKVKTKGIENIPVGQGERLLFVGNHQLWGLDVGLKWPTIYKETGLYLRAVTDRSHSHIPIFKHMIILTGGVPGTRESTQSLMDKGLPLLIYPGGANEVFKGPNEDPYALFWADRTGFARMAAENGYKIVPFASVGIADSVRVLFTLPARWLWMIIGDKRSKAGEPRIDTDDERTPQPQSAPHERRPKAMGDGIPILNPVYLNPQANYLVFGEPIDAAAFVAKEGDSEAAVFALRDRVKESVEEGIRSALKWREGDPERFTFGSEGLIGWLSRLLNLPKSDAKEKVE